MIELQAGLARCVVSPLDGGRVSKLQIGSQQLIVEGSSRDNPLHWGSYPMVPWAGRVTHGIFEFAGKTHQLPIVLDSHAIHGTTYLLAWQTEHVEYDTATISTDLGVDWPFGGSARQVFTLTDQSLECQLSVTATEQAMPVSLGWHPWFLKPESDQLHFTTMYERMSNNIPSGNLVQPKQRPWDDCFLKPTAPLQLHYPNLTVTISSPCDHWIVYDEPPHAICVEPQTGPANQFNSGAYVLPEGQTLSQTMLISWE
jgi:aldose 1-epimerase